jgi:DNA-directed RNA polymerase specialized sigma24 family protein
MEEMNAERLTDAELMEAVVRRDSAAMAAIYERYESMLRAVISSILHEGDETEDVLQRQR